VDRGRWRPFRPVVKLNGSPPPPPPPHTFAGSHAEPPGHAGQHTVPTHTHSTHIHFYTFFFLSNKTYFDWATRTGLDSLSLSTLYSV
jgi:hypothetical protein